MKKTFNRGAFLGKELDYIKQAIENGHISGDGPFTKKCHAWFEKNQGLKHALMTTSCSSALDMSALLAEVGPGDEVIVPSFTFVTSANAFALRGAKIVFVDIRKDTLNIDENLIEAAITPKTKAIVAVHYAGIGAEMDKIMKIARKHKLLVVEDAAQATLAKYRGKMLGSIGHLSTFSFHETKNHTCGEGGMLGVNREKYFERAEIIREKGTNRSKFFRGQVDKYSWVDLGSSYLPSELNAAYLWAHLESAKIINNNRLKSWKKYNEGLEDLAAKGDIELPFVPEYCEHNGHIFYIKVDGLETRTKLLQYLKKLKIGAVFHYVPLHDSKAGKKYGRLSGKCQNTITESERLIRLPMYYDLEEDYRDFVIEKLYKFF